MPGRLRAVIVPALALLQHSAAEPTDPTITALAVLPRQNSDSFIGYVELNNTCEFALDHLRASLTILQGVALTVSPTNSEFRHI